MCIKRLIQALGNKAKQCGLLPSWACTTELHTGELKAGRSHTAKRCSRCVASATPSFSANGATLNSSLNVQSSLSLTLPCLSHRSAMEWLHSTCARHFWWPQNLWFMLTLFSSSVACTQDDVHRKTDSSTLQVQQSNVIFYQLRPAHKTMFIKTLILALGNKAMWFSTKFSNAHKTMLIKRLIPKSITIQFDINLLTTLIIWSFAIHNLLTGRIIAMVFNDVTIGWQIKYTW